MKVFDITLEKVSKIIIKVPAESEDAAKEKVASDGYLAFAEEKDLYDGCMYHDWVTSKKHIISNKVICEDLYMYACHTLYTLYTETLEECEAVFSPSVDDVECHKADQKMYKKIYKHLKDKNWQKCYKAYRKCDTALRECVPTVIVEYIEQMAGEYE